MIRSSREHYGGVIAGLGGGLCLSAVLYNYFPGSGIHDPMIIVGWVLLIYGKILAGRFLKRETRKSSSEET